MVYDILQDQPKGHETIDANGIRTIVEYTTNEDGKKVKVSSDRSQPSRKMSIASFLQLLTLFLPKDYP